VAEDDRRKCVTPQCRAETVDDTERKVGNQLIAANPGFLQLHVVIFL
jgi:hypothetical protein